MSLIYMHRRLYSSYIGDDQPTIMTYSAPANIPLLPKSYQGRAVPLV